MFALICAWVNEWANNGEAGDLRRHRAHYDLIVMCGSFVVSAWFPKLSSVAWYTKIKLIDDNILNNTKKNDV